MTLEEAMASYFSNLSYMLETGWRIVPEIGSDPFHAFKAMVSMLVSLVGNDVEGMGPSPQELEVKDVDVLHRFVTSLSWELLRTIHADCWDHLQLNFIRFVGDAILIAYHGVKSFRSPDVNELPFLPAFLEEC